MKSILEVNPVDWTKVALFCLLLTGIYYSTLTWLVEKDWGRQDYSYGYMIPLIMLYLFWEKRQDFFGKAAAPTWYGLLLFLPGLFIFWLGELAGEYYALYFSFWLLLVGICWMSFGWRKMKTIGFALIIALGMFPPPHFIHDRLTLKLKLISSEIGVAMMQLFGMSVYREGNVIDLGFTQLQVVDACSGLRYLFPLIIMGLLLAYFYKAAFWKKALTVVSAIPLTIITNSLRIAFTGILSEIWGPAVAEGFFHGFSGWFIFMFSLAVLLFEMWALNGFGSFRSLGFFGSLNKNDLATDTHRRTQTSESELIAHSRSTSSSRPIGSKLNAPDVQNDNIISSEQIHQTQNTKHQTPWLKAIFHPPQFIVAVLLLGVTLAIAQTVDFREKIPMSRSFAEFPLQVGEWTGQRAAMEQRFIDTLDLSDYVIIEYGDRHGKIVNFYTAYYESQRKGESIHSPETCLPGSGWEFKNAGSVTLPLKSRNGQPMRVNKALMEKAANRQLSYFWFPQRDRVLTNVYELKIYNFCDALMRQRTDGALVRLITPVYPGEEVGDADERLTAFTQMIVPVLNEFLPE